MVGMPISCTADADFAIPARPARRRANRSLAHGPDRLDAGHRWLGLPPLQEASLVGIVCLSVAWGVAELALILSGV